jgi:DNA repair exonuclease SbcCD ATPase subunit
LFAQERTKSDALVQIGKNKAKLEQLSKDQEDASVLLNKSKVLETVQAAFHKNGIPAIILKTQLPAINAELANLLGGLVDFNITFETEPGSNSMDVYIEDGHSRRILELGSGMEKMIASIAIRVALCNLSSLPKSNLIILDEGFNALDEEHVGKCLELLQTLKSGFKTIMVISHMQRVKEAADSIIEVVSTGQDSRVEA